MKRPHLSQHIIKWELLLDGLAVVTLALVMRLWGLGFDLPNLYHRDEAKYVSIALRVLKTGDYNPHFFNYPSLFFYLLAIAYIPYVLYMAAHGRLMSLQGLVLPEQVLENVVGIAHMPSQLLVGRAVVAMFGVLTVLGTYWLGRAAYGRRAGIVAALMLAISPTHVRNSHFVAPDVAMAFFVLAAFVFCLRIWQEGRWRHYILCGLFAGLSISTKYNAYPILLTMILAHALRGPIRRDARPVAVGLGAAACGFLLTTPFSLLDLSAFLNGVAFEMYHYATMGDPGIEGQNGLLWYAAYLIRNEGIVPLIAAVEGIVGVLSRSMKTLLLASFPAIYLGATSLYVVKNDRTVLAILPFLAILCGGLVERLGDRLASLVGGKRRALQAALLLGLAALIVTPLVQSVAINRRFSAEDVRTLVTVWLDAKVPAGSRIAGEYYSPLLERSPHVFHWVDRAIDLPISWYQDNVDYLVLVENRYGGYRLDPARYPEQIAAYDQLTTQFELVKEFEGGALGNPCHAMVLKVGRP